MEELQSQKGRGEKSAQKIIKRWDPLIKDGKIVWIQIEVRVKGWKKGTG